MSPYYVDELEDYYQDGLDGISHMMEQGYYDYYDGSDEEFAMPLPRRRQRIRERRYRRTRNRTPSGFTGARTIIPVSPTLMKPSTGPATTTIATDAVATEIAVVVDEQAVVDVQTPAVKKFTTIISSSVISLGALDPMPTRHNRTVCSR
ncbi:hypothetical protein McaMca56_005610 [Microsporum canis]